MSLAIVSRFIGFGTVEAIGDAAGVGMGLTCGAGIGLEGNVVEVEFGGTIIGRGLETTEPMVSGAVLHAFFTSWSW